MATGETKQPGRLAPAFTKPLSISSTQPSRSARPLLSFAETLIPEASAMPTYAATMDRGAAEYAEHLNALRASGLPADFTQTGGMCAALEVRLERGYLLITDAGEELPWARDYQRGWGVGYYKCDDVSDGPIEYVESPDQTDAGALLALVRDCLQAVASSR